MPDFYTFLSDDRDFYYLLTPESSLSGGELHFIVECMTLSSKSSLPTGYSECDIEISVAIASSMTLSSHLHTHPIFDSSWDFYIFFYRSIIIFFSMTCTAFFYDFLTTTTTGRTYSFLLHHTEYRLHTFTHSSTSLTCITGRRFSSLPMTCITGRSTLKLYFAIITTDCIFEREGHLNLDIFSDICSFATTSSTSSEK